ncbi:ABC transporter substrate-binding protein [Sporosarcina psychrophila]|uniref:ABC transporter substrate-binding protein n=1 Tax=Sporosarcina psychrophila TaxID=1476 RepID=UPI00078C6BF5|nr:ABC transporter substrate-binding protein [Sporosarcina psychrophila]AMQ07981.1 iron ABC transporter substrate-binding protein [Sporosarcina psychrophila]
MKKIWQLGLTAFLAVFLLAACGTAATPDKPKVDGTPEAEVVKADFPLTLTDSVGNEITLETAPATIVSMVPSNTEILFELGLGDAIVGVNDYDDYPAEALKKEKIGGQDFNVEKIVSMNPEIVFAHESGLGKGKEGLQQIRDAGIPVFVVKNAASFEETYTTIETIGQATGKTVEAEKIITDMKAKVEDVLAKLVTVDNKKTVFVETSPEPNIYTPGKNTFMDQMLEMIGAENIAADQEDWFMIAPEEIINRNPDVIIVLYDYIETAVADVYARPGFDTITAIKEKAVVQVKENITSRTGPRLAEGLEEIAKAIYPEAFGE